MKKIIALLIIVSAITIDLSAQDVKSESKQFMQINTVESVVSGGFGRSKMIITTPDGSQTETDLENLFSLVGINFKNIRDNEDKVIKTLKSYDDKGWKMEQVTSFTLSPGNNGGIGIFMTRYLLSKAEG